MGCQAVSSSGRNLQAFFEPTSICVVGATDDAAKWGHGIARAALRSDNDRPVFLVNRAREVVLDRPAYASVSAVPGPIDLVVVCVPAAHFLDVVDDALAAGARGILGITSGLGETDAGRQAEMEAVSRIRARGAAMIGPNCLGLVDNTSGVLLAAGEFAPGDVALLSQSGNLALELQTWFTATGLGFSRFVSVGNQADVTLVDLIDSCIDDARTRAIAVYAEDFGDGRAFLSAARRAHDAGKPVVILPAVDGEAARRSAKSHTGALTSGLDVIAASAAFSGGVVVHSPRELAHALVATRQPARLSGRRIAVVTDGGGHGTLAAATLEGRGWPVPELSAATQSRLLESLWPQSSVSNPVDLAGYGEQDVASYANVVETLLADDGVDAVLMTGYFGGYASANAFAAGLAEGEIAAAARIADASHHSGKPVVVQSMSIPSPSLDALTSGGVTVLAAIEDAVAALSHLTERRLTDLPPSVAPMAPPDSSDYAATKAYLADLGVPVVRSIAVASQIEILAAAELVPAPYVLKATGQLHKSEGGGVVLGLRDVDELLDAYEVIQDRLPGVACAVEGFVDTTKGLELLVGVTRDPRFGPVLTVGAGGIWAEVLNDTACTLAPATAATVADLVLSLRLAPLLGEFRGRPALAFPALCEVIASLSTIASAVESWAEFECNPILVTPTEVLVLDARSVSR